MGCLRAIFAISVVLAHSYGFIFVGGRNAVQLFYIISGFLISYVIIERRSYRKALNFYISRLLRLYPIYFIIASLSLIAFLIGMHSNEKIEFFKIYKNSPLSANFLLILSNLSLLFQDWVMFLGVQKNQLVFLSDFSKSEVLLYQGLLVPQAWTLGVELTFYLIAPFILTRKKILFTLLLLSIFLRMYLIYLGIGLKDPWTYRFFPTELALFILGALSHQIILPFIKKRFPRKSIDKYSKIVTTTLIFLCIIYWLIPIKEIYKVLTLYLFFILLMPFTFIFSENRKWDKWVGNLSYPIYICHLFIIYLIPFFIATTKKGELMFSYYVVIFSITFSIILNKYIGNQSESFRDKFKN